VAPEGETVENEQGGRQSFTEADFSQVPPFALRLLAQCCGFGSRKYGPGNWKKIPIESQIAHAMNHLNEFRLGDRSEPHLVNAAVRVMFALELAVENGLQGARYVHPDMTPLVTDPFLTAVTHFRFGEYSPHTNGMPYVGSDLIECAPIGVASFDREGLHKGATSADPNTDTQ
jgi:hypothetical protein